MTTEFLKPRLVGTRFENHSIPVEVLKDWVAFEGLIIEAARWLYFEQNPTRKRIPRGFAQTFSLNLREIEKGSAVVTFDLPQSSALPLHYKFAEWFEKARDRVLDTIEAASAGRPVDELLPKSLLAYFDTFGRSLRDNEQIEFARVPQGHTVVYNHRVRKTLVLKSAGVYRTEEPVRGSMSELNFENNTFTLKLINGHKVVGQFSDELREAAHNALGAFGESLVMVEGAVVRDQSDKRIRIEQVTRIEPLDPLDVPARLEQLALLDAGWLDGEGQSLARDSLDWLSKTWLERWPTDLSLPYVYPTTSGNVQFEWGTSECTISVELELDARFAHYIASRTSDGELLTEIEINLSSDAGWNTLVGAARHLLEGN